MQLFWWPSRQRNGAKTTHKLGNLNIKIVSSTLLRPDQAFERPQRPTESPTTPIFTPEVPAADARSGVGRGSVGVFAVDRAGVRASAKAGVAIRVGAGVAVGA